MAYSESDLTTIESAITSLAAGTRKVRATLNGKTVEYGQVDLAQLRSLRDQIQAEVSSAAGRRRFVLTSTSKGL